MSSTNFSLYSKYYDLLYETKEYQKEVDYLVKTITTYLPQAKSILELGSGTGKHGLLLQEKGYEVFGVERSETMVEEASKLGYPCITADISSFTLDRKFDVVLSLFHVISYLTDNKSLISTFKNAHHCLNKEGFFIFDVWYAPAVHNLKPENRVKRVSNNDIEVIRIAEPIHKVNDNVIDVNYSILIKEKSTNTTQEIKECHPMRFYSIKEIELLALFTGFELIKAEEFGSGLPASEDTWGVNFILKKI